MWRKWRLVSAVAVLTLSACTQPPPVLLKNVRIGEDYGLATDVRSRLFTESEPGLFTRPGQIDPQTILCVEPPPDVAVALAGSVGFGIGVQGAGSASLSASQVEGVAQLAERTAGIQALLHQAYRACVDYRNGAIKDPIDRGRSWAFIGCTENDIRLGRAVHRGWPFGPCADPGRSG